MTNEKMMKDLMSLFEDDKNGAALAELETREIVRAAIAARLTQLYVVIFSYNQSEDVNERRRLCGLYEEYTRREEKADDWVRP
jgi:hypothetical protein